MMNESDDEARELIRGNVKWFDTTKGFGFIVADCGGPDILLHANVLRNFGQGSVADGAGIEVFVQLTPRGKQAVEIVSIQQPEGVSMALIEDLSPEVAAQVPNLPIEPARVKWFDKGKGFGFANVFGRPEDIFIHIEVLRQSGLAELQPSEAIGLRIIDGRRGRMAVQVLSWEAALRK
jgi:CspA family cold shock protein